MLFAISQITHRFSHLQFDVMSVFVSYKKYLRVASVSDLGSFHVSTLHSHCRLSVYKN